MRARKARKGCEGCKDAEAPARYRAVYDAYLCNPCFVNGSPVVASTPAFDVIPIIGTMGENAAMRPCRVTPATPDEDDEEWVVGSHGED